MPLNPLIKTAIIAAALGASLLLGGCGRRGMPVPIDPATPAENGEAKPALPHGIDDNSLRAGAPKTKSIFDSIL